MEGCTEEMMRGHIPPYPGFIWDPIRYQVEELAERQRERRRNFCVPHDLFKSVWKRYRWVFSLDTLIQRRGTRSVASPNVCSSVSHLLFRASGFCFGFPSLLRMSFPYFLSILQASGTFDFRTTPPIPVLLAPTYSPYELLQQPVLLHICSRVCLLQQPAGLCIFIMFLTDH